MKTCTCGIDIMEHPASRCLDALVAEKVMGWEVQGNVILMPDGDFSYLVPDLGGHWTPSQDISDAMEVMARMFARGIVQFSNGDGDSCDVSISPYSEFMINETLQFALVSVDGITLADFCLAICRTTLLTVEE